MSFCVRLISLSILFSGLICIVLCIKILVLLRLNSSLCAQTTFCLAVHLLMDAWVSWALLAFGLMSQSAVSRGWSPEAQLGCRSKRARSLLAGNAGCPRGAQLGQLFDVSTLGLSMWLGLLIAYQPSSERVQPGSECFQRWEVDAAGP